MTIILTICLVQIATKLPEMAHAADLLEKLNAFELDTGDNVDDEFDYDVRAEAVSPLVENGVLELGKVTYLLLAWCDYSLIAVRSC